MKRCIQILFVFVVSCICTQTVSANTYSYNGHQYTVVQSDSIAWNDAQAAAVASGGWLATITDASEQSFIGTILSDYPSWNQLWLGGYQTAPSSNPSANWAWVTGETWNYTHWNAGEPNDGYGYASEEYLAIISWDIYPGISGKWNDDGTAISTINGYLVESVAPEPISSILFLTGGAVLGGRSFLRRRKATA